MLILHTLERKERELLEKWNLMHLLQAKNTLMIFYKAAKVQANHIFQKSHFSHPSEPSKLTRILTPGDFGAIVANVNKPKPKEAVMTEQYDWYSRAGGNSGALSMQSAFDKVVRKNDPKTKIA